MHIVNSGAIIHLIGGLMVNMRSFLHPQYVGWTLFFLSLAVFCAYHLSTSSQYEDALHQGLFFVR
jgi:hypothetical protein